MDRIDRIDRINSTAEMDLWTNFKLFRPKLSLNRTKNGRSDRIDSIGVCMYMMDVDSAYMTYVAYMTETVMRLACMCSKMIQKYAQNCSSTLRGQDKWLFVF